MGLRCCVGVLALNNRKWTQEEINNLIYYIKHGFSRVSCTKLLNRSLQAVNYKITDLGLGVKKIKKWTQEEIDELQRLFEGATNLTECAQKLNRSINSIKIKANKLGLTTRKFKKWTHNEEKRLQEYRDKNLSYAQCAKNLNRSISSVSARAHLLGFIKPEDSREKWTQEEIEYLLYCIKRHVSHKECAQKLNRSIKSVQAAICRYKGKTIYNFPNQKKRENELEMCLNCTMPDCTNCLGGGN